MWHKVPTIGIDGQLLIVHPTGGGRPHTFSASNLREARVAHTVASLIFMQHATPATPATRRRRGVPSAATPPDDQRAVPFDLGAPAGLCRFNIRTLVHGTADA